jgi:hypothetical protein
MLARILGLALLILTLPMQGMAADGSMALQIGDSKLQAPVPEGYVRASEHAPAWFAGTAAALPPATRLVETLVASSDLKRMLMGESPQRPYLQIQVLRDAERVDFTMAEWTALQPVLVQQFGGFDATPRCSRRAWASACRRPPVPRLKSRMAKWASR